jgi:uncharacterized protein YtpQ (UPF0354 family)
MLDLNQSEGLLVVGIPEDSLVLLQAISEKTGNDIVTVLAKSVVFLARSVLNETELNQLNMKLKKRG